MTGLMTAAEAAAQKKKENTPKNSSGGGSSLPPPVPVKKKVFVFLHPENGTLENQNFHDTITIAGIPCERKVERGVLRTQDRLLAGFLTAKGWQLLDTVEIEE